jgi:hypothetical protein
MERLFYRGELFGFANDSEMAYGNNHGQIEVLTTWQ